MLLVLLHILQLCCFAWARSKSRYQDSQQSVVVRQSSVALTTKATTAEADNIIPLLACCRRYWAYDAMAIHENIFFW